MNLSGLFCPEASVVGLKSDARDAVIAELVDMLVSSGKLDAAHRNAVLEGVLMRENEASTGIGKGVAVPHVKCDIVDEPIGAYGLSVEGIDFASLDKQPVYSVFLVLGPEKYPEKHLVAMETIFKSLQNDDFRSFLRQAKSVNDVMTLFGQVDNNQI
ncbi:MAG: PTS sugar transporter subunit IIA [Phycisphaerae bacterium]|jgi:mannitol/fructose-specific phosphotransferase system IIA component (Ntr-type)